MIRLRDWCFSLYCRYFSQPTGERILFRHMLRQRPSRIVEIGMGDGSRAIRIAEFLRRTAPDHELKFFGIDLFEAGPYAAEGWSLKVAHQLLKQQGAQARLFPGDPLSVLNRQANGLTNTDLLLIGDELNEEEYESCWRFLPRMLSDQTAVFVAELEGGEEDEDATSTYRQLTPFEIEQRCGKQHSHVRRAA